MTEKLSNEKVSVIGGGSWGTTIAHLLAENGHETLLWLRRKDICDAINESHENPRHLPGLPLSKSPSAPQTTSKRPSLRSTHWSLRFPRRPFEKSSVNPRPGCGAIRSP
jgi:glycerol-3-phosphate dehydrogenase (NAD(P)+)